VMTAESDARVVDNIDEQRYELWLGEVRAGVIEYDLAPGIVVAIHTKIDPAFEGRGLATKLIAGAIEDIRDRGFKLVPVCAFVRAYLRRHPQARDIVVPPSATQT
jgi:predicted GNAT family acetyltransferase